MDGYEYAVYDGYDDDSGVYDYSLKSKIGKFNHTFSLRDFPFDEQKILLRVTIDGDSSVYRFNERKIESDIFNVRGLDEGYFADRITYSLGYQKTSDFKYFSPGDKRALVKPYIEYNIIVSRKGSLLFIKLFLGTFLGVLMSLSCYYINKRHFGSRIDISVGALFICVGNKYFVESVTPITQILTKADIINNLSLILIIINVFIVIGQHKPDINIGKFEDSKYALKVSSALFLFTLLLTILV